MQLLRSEEGAEYSAMDATADGNTAFLADKDGALEVVDTRQAADTKSAAVRCCQQPALPPCASTRVAVVFHSPRI